MTWLVTYHPYFLKTCLIQKKHVSLYIKLYYMKTKYKILLALAAIAVNFAVHANNLEEIRDILKHVETNLNPNIIGDHGTAYGILQIRQGAIKDVNEFYGTSYTLDEMTQIGCAEEVFELYIKRWTDHLEKKEKRAATTEDIIRIWNGGPNGWKRSSTLDYVKKYYKYKKQYDMNKRQCKVRGKLGVVTASYTHTYDVFLFKNRTTINVKRSLVKLLPIPKEKKGDPNQIPLWHT